MAAFCSIKLLTRTHKFIYIYLYKAFSVYIQSDLNPVFSTFVSSHATVELLNNRYMNKLQVADLHFERFCKIFRC
jgi:hypothetical protein